MRKPKTPNLKVPRDSEIPELRNIPYIIVGSPNLIEGTFLSYGILGSLGRGLREQLNPTPEKLDS